MRGTNKFDPTVQGTKWVFTLNNWTQEEYDALWVVECRYMVLGKETGEAGTPHLQGYVVFSANKRLSACKGLAERAHWELARGTHEQASTYCKKDGDFAERGELPRERRSAGGRERERWADAAESAKRGDVDAIPGDILLRSYGNIKRIQRDHMVGVQDADDVTGFWLYGESGAGKSRGARLRFPDFYSKMCNKWWDGYQGQPAAIVDDFDKSHAVLGHHLKIWGDRYAFIGEVKGDSRPIRPGAIVVTSQYRPEEIWDDDATLAAITRRYKLIKVREGEDVQWE